MLALNHTLVGAGIGSQIDNIPTVIGLSIVSHFVLDFLPHVDPGTELAEGGLKPAIKYFLAGMDVFASVFIIVLILLARPGLNQAAVIIGAITAILMDIIFNFPLWEQWTKKTWPFSAVSKFHEKIHEPLKKYQYSVGIPLQLIIVIISVWVLLR